MVERKRTKGRRAMQRMSGRCRAFEIQVDLNFKRPGLNFKFSHEFISHLFRLLLSSPRSHSVYFGLDRQPSFEFIGVESFKWTLGGGEDLVVPLTVEISRSGVYNLQSLRLTVKREEVEIPYYFPWQWIMNVSDI